MKRSQSICLTAMRKSAAAALTPKVIPKAKPLALAIATATLMACSQQPQEVAESAFKNVEECVVSNSGTLSECQKAYDKAMAEAQQNAPRFTNQEACNINYGENCVQQRDSNGNSWFMPAMAGFLIGQALNNNRQVYSQPLYPAVGGGFNRNSYSTGDGRNQNFSPDRKPVIKKVESTKSRSGFGSTAAAKSNWGGKTSGGWGG